jgi:YHS domain-containing protein
MNTKICPTCGCSLVRLGISEKSATTLKYKDKVYFFCCSGCAKLFNTEKEKYLKELENTIVCPVCLAEKQREHTTIVTYNNEEIYFCRCPHCISTFKDKPKYYLDRLSGKIKHEGLFNDLCC